MFKNNPNNLLPETNRKFNLIGTPLEKTQDFIYLSKLRETVSRYQSARFMLNQTSPHDWEYWTYRNETEEAKEYCKLLVRSEFYEAALIFYCIVVELSWQLTYVSLEKFLINVDREKYISLGGLIEKEEAEELLRGLEELCPEPSKDWYSYKKKSEPPLARTIDHVRKFKDHSTYVELKKEYNFIKHRGKIQYEEMAEYVSRNFFVVNSVNDKGEIIELISSSDDMFKKKNLMESIEKLVNFDNEILYPYLEELVRLVSEIVSISPYSY